MNSINPLGFFADTRLIPVLKSALPHAGTIVAAAVFSWQGIRVSVEWFSKAGHEMKSNHR